MPHLPLFRDTAELTAFGVGTSNGSGCGFGLLVVLIQAITGASSLVGIKADPHVSVNGH